MLFCEKCGNQLADDAVFCNKCGRKVIKSNFSVQEETVSPPVTEVAQDGKKDSTKKGCIVMVVVFIIIVVLVGSCQSGRSDSSGESKTGTSSTSESSESMEEFKNSCNSYDFELIERNPSEYNGKRAILKGKVAQVVENGNDLILLVDITTSDDAWSFETHMVYVEYTKKSSSESRILEHDEIKMYGTLKGTTTYETLLGQQRTVPVLDAKYIDII